MAQYGLIKSFDIDNGELAEQSPQQCFVLGYELAEIDHLLKCDEGIHKPVHAENLARIKKSCEDSGRHFRLSWMPGDPSESWMLLLVQPSGEAPDKNACQHG